MNVVSPLASVTILGIPVHRLTFERALAGIQHMIEKGERGYIVTANPEIIMRAYRDPAYRRVILGARQIWPDGIGVLFAARVLGTQLPERVTGSDGVPLIARLAAREGWRVYLLGARPGVAVAAARRLQARYPGLKIVGAEAGDPRPSYDAVIRERINAVRPHILFVAYGAPKQEWWMARNIPHVRVNVAIGVGGAFDFIVGVQKRAPRLWRRLGLEWLWRLLLEPRRWRRQLALPQFAALVLLQRLGGRSAQGPPTPE